MTQVVLIRTGATVYDEQNRVQGILDIPLSARGEAEVAELAEKLAEPLAGVELAALYCGPGESTLQTAEVIGKALGLRPKRVDELRNLDQGLWQGLQVDEIKRRNHFSPAAPVSSSGSRATAPMAASARCSTVSDEK